MSNKIKLPVKVVLSDALRVPEAEVAAGKCYLYSEEIPGIGKVAATVVVTSITRATLVCQILYVHSLSVAAKMSGQFEEGQKCIARKDTLWYHCELSSAGQEGMLHFLDPLEPMSLPGLVFMAVVTMTENPVLALQAALNIGAHDDRMPIPDPKE